MATLVIPARYASERLPGKPLAEVAGKPLVVWVIENAARARCAARCLVATDDERIAEAVRNAGYEAFMTSPDHPTGTDRIAEVARGIDDDIWVNVQGDEPEIDPATIDSVVDVLKNDPGLDLATAATPIRTAEDHKSPHVVKVVTDLTGRALYFSRAPVPHMRAGASEALGDEAHQNENALAHVGLYAYRREALLRMVDAEQTPLERCERLEQLRALENGMSIGVTIVEDSPVGIDVPEELEAFRRRVEQR